MTRNSMPTNPARAAFLLRTALPLAALSLAAAAPAQASDIDRLQAIGQAEFRLLSEDLGAALSYKPLVPTAPLGITGFDAGVALTGTRIRHPDIFDRVTSSSDTFPSTLPVPSLRLDKGLPLDFDVGLMYSQIPGTNIKLGGGALKYAFVPGNVALPAVGVRGAFTKLFGVDQLDLQTASADLSVSKGIALFTPYAGVGRVWVKSTPASSTGLHGESFSLNKYFLGLNFKLGVAALDLEWDRTGPANTVGAKIGVRF
jgi:hypothetical protein